MATPLICLAGPSGLPLDVLLSSIPSVPRPVLERLVQRAIDHLDDLDGEPDEEDDDPPEDNADYEPGYSPALDINVS